MSALAIDADPTGVTALVVTPDGQVAARGHRELHEHFPQSGWVEQAPEEIWQATVGATRECLGEWDGAPGDLTGVGISDRSGTILLWDRETLGSPRRAIGGQDRRGPDIGSRLRWVAEHEPNTWALVHEGRYAIGTVDSYVIARMTRGTWHVIDVGAAGRTLLLDLEQGAWSEERCGRYDVPVDALPDVISRWGELARTEPRSFLGLDLPITGRSDPL